MANVRLLSYLQSMRSIRRTTVVGVLACCLLQAWPTSPAQGLPLARRPLTESKQSKAKSIYVDFPSSGAPQKRSRSTGSRGKCPGTAASSQLLQALVPPTKEGLGKTTSNGAMAWFYVPFQTNDFHSMKIVMEQIEGGKSVQELYVGQINASMQSPGIVGIEIPPTAVSLAVGQQYKLRLFVQCSDPTTTTTKKIRVAGDLERIAQGKSWQDELTRLGRQQCSGSGNKTEWSRLLGMADFQEFASAPVSCLKPSASS